MGLVFYNIFLFLYGTGIRLAAIFSSKARKWVTGRQNIWEKLTTEMADQQSKVIWVHCASLGEFEQGRPIIERLKVDYPNYKLVLTFFSPSGYEIRKNYEKADWVFYLPMDSAYNAKIFLEIVRPSLVIFVKYEFWYYYLKQINHQKIPLLLISALFRESSIFFKWYGGLHRKMLSFFDQLFVQNESSHKMLASIKLDGKSTIAGDTRFDRVIQIAENFLSIPAIEKFVEHGKKTIVAGSTWPADEELLQRSLLALHDSASLQLIIAPHEINKEHLSQLQQLFPGSLLFSQLVAGNQPDSLPSTGNILIIDNIGMLSRLYKYATISYIGGGFGKGIHNTLEAAVYGSPVLFGPNYKKFNEAIDLITAGGAISINDPKEGVRAIEAFMHDEITYNKACEKSKEYVYANRGAAERILNYIQEKRLLTN
ncbi:3-deoxy-D-manno-octulosonic acid transferase [Terrimonas alba]|uniref:3-deoxy-D-manno-octulosonic acid transferase n=1 Tax=Terrimonas alba TaxID=3349636 RepID=UPI0035F395E6